MKKYMKILYAVMNTCLPTILFYLIYRFQGIIVATGISVLLNGISLSVQYFKNREVTNTAVLGLLGLLGAAIAIYFTGNEKYYYVPGLAINILLFFFFCVLSLKKKSIVHYLAKDFEITAINLLPQENLFLLNIIWLIFFGLKIVFKVMGLIYLDFDKLYWLVFWMGDPAMVAMIILSIVIIRIQFIHKNKAAR